MTIITGREGNDAHLVGTAACLTMRGIPEAIADCLSVYNGDTGGSGATWRLPSSPLEPFSAPTTTHLFSPAA